MSSPYNLSRYNLLGYNVTPQGSIFAVVVASDDIGFISVSSSSRVYPNARLYETFGKIRLQLAPGRFAAVRGSDEITVTKADATSCFWRFIASSDNFDINAHLSGRFRSKAKTSDAIDGTLHLSQSVFQSAKSDDVINGNFHLSQIVFPASSASDLINAVCSAESINIRTCVLTVTLQPGQTMIIDANTYNVWIDQVNMVKIHSGDWLDELDRNTLSFDINAGQGAGNLEASILYTERYL